MAARPYDRTPGPHEIPETLPDHAGRGLPGGVELYLLGPDGGIVLADREGTRELGPERDFLRFIDDGQFAHYLVGDAATSPERPSNATVKLGVVSPRSAFTPHAHGGEHFVLSLGHAACGLYDPDRGRVNEVRLAPGMLIRIPEMMPHSFANRGDAPLTILAANTGYGIDHEDYAITAAEAERRASAGLVRTGLVGHGAPAVVTAAATSTSTSTSTDYQVLAAALRDIERAQRVHGIAGTTVRERLAARLRRAATALEVRR
ncbi:cupin domain-containing protein [Streptomyces sp. NBC_01351]|uniref:cupin domain-containing protein n=1 Tax=Streptomyces sp. NBC_01351 TaxID=2903833 RepID=UPI002E323295|nr:cupin domain-containing protein [Streptomyces sp. NBC_01351]